MAFVLGAALRVLAADRRPARPTPHDQAQAYEPPPPATGAHLPDPQMPPEEVVEQQLRALARCRDDRSAIHQAWAYASDANRAVTGPIGRFERMILKRPYSTMVVGRDWRVGRAAQSGDMATVLATVVGPHSEVALFRYYLSRSPDEAQGAWLVDQVFCLTGGESADDPPPPSM